MCPQPMSWLPRKRMDNDLEAIKQRKVEELQMSMNEQMRQQAEIQQQVQSLENFVKAKLTKKALERYGNLKTAHPEKAVQLLAILAQALQTQNIQQINDEQLKDLLKRMEPKKHDFKITRK